MSDALRRRYLLNDPEPWRGRAAEARAIALRMEYPPARNSMLEIAATYELLAAQAAQQIFPGNPQMTPEFARAQTERCRRLSNRVRDLKLAGDLRQLAEDFQEQAAVLERLQEKRAPPA